jgi:hypothetical protein
MTLTIASLLCVIVFSNIATPAYATCTVPANCPLIPDDTHYVYGHGAAITINDSNPGASPTIDLRFFDNATNTQIGTTLSGLHMMHLAGAPNVTLASPGTSNPTYVMFNGHATSNLTDPPTLNVGNMVPTNTNYFTVRYNDSMGNSITFLKKFSIEDNYSSVTAFQPPYPSAGPQPYKTVIVSCSDVIHGRAGTSGDFICDAWKSSGHLSIPYTDSSGKSVTYNWSCNNNLDHNTNIFAPMPVDFPCPMVGQKDVYVEIDYMYNHKPSRQALLDVINAYKSHHVYLHILLSDEIPHKVLTSGPNNGADTSQFTKIKNIYFGNSTERNPPFPTGCGNTLNAAQCTTDILTAKRQVFHYALFGHSQSANPTSSGISEVSSASPYSAANDMFITLGAFSYHVGSLDQQEGTFMHELGHNLGLAHGGPYAISGNPPPDANENCKPNYLSVMSWTRQFSTLFLSNPRALDYSNESNSAFSINTQLGNVNEVPVSVKNQYTVYSILGTTWSSPTPANNPDWDNDLTTEATADSPEANWQGAPNAGPFNNGTTGGNSAFVTITCPSASQTILNTYDDWANLKFDMTPTSSFSDGAGAKDKK